jgi:hypothetical protein
MEELDQGSLHPLIKHPETDMSRPGIETQQAAFVTGVPSTKELASEMLIWLHVQDSEYWKTFVIV